MKANELRIGNLINVLNPKTNEWNIEKTKGKTIVNFQENSTHELMINNFKPIPLTEGWLLNFGFDECLNGFWCSESYVNVKIIDNISIFLRGEDIDLNWHNKIEYVHQLQNLYFALTGKELECH